MNELILNTQENVELKTQATKDKQFLVKSTAKQLHVDRDVIYAYADFLHYKGNGWDEGPLKLIPDAPFKDKVSPTFIKLLKIVNVLREVNDLEFLQPYLTALRDNGITINISPVEKAIDKDFLQNQMEAIDEQQTIICENADVIKDTGLLAEEEQFSTKSKFQNLTESYYKITNTDKGQKVADKLSKDFVQNTMNNSAISSILSETKE